MFDRFTKEARVAVAHAQLVARDSASRTIDSRHLLVAVAEVPGSARRALAAANADLTALTGAARTDLRRGSIDADALAGIGIDLDAVSQEADAVFGPDSLLRAGRKSGGHIPFTSDAKETLELALREAMRLKHKRLNTSHVLLGIMRAKGPGHASLAHAGVDSEDLRRQLEKLPDRTSE